MYKSYITNCHLDPSITNCIPNGPGAIITSALETSSGIDESIFFMDKKLDDLGVMQVRLDGAALMSKSEYIRLKSAAGESVT